MEGPKGSPPRTGDGTPASVPPLNQVQHRQLTLSDSTDQPLATLLGRPQLTLAEKRARDAGVVNSDVEHAKRSPTWARHWSREYLDAANRLDNEGGHYPSLAALAANLRARAAAMQAVWA